MEKKKVKGNRMGEQPNMNAKQKKASYLECRRLLS